VSRCSGKPQHTPSGLTDLEGGEKVCVLRLMAQVSLSEEDGESERDTAASCSPFATHPSRTPYTARLALLGHFHRTAEARSYRLQLNTAKGVSDE
jgi:hypothetical protein